MAVFMHLTTSEFPNPFWGSILKSNGNGTYFGESLQYVNRNDRGFVDFEKMIGLDGVALINVVTNPETARLEGRKVLQSRISHNDGGSWKPVLPPKVDSYGKEYACNRVVRVLRCCAVCAGLMVCRDARTQRSTPVNPLVLETTEDHALYTIGEGSLQKESLRLIVN